MEKDCECLTHEGAHYLHVDALWKVSNDEIHANAKEYRGAPNLAAHLRFVALMHAYGREEQARLLAKAQAMQAHALENPEI